jgi:Kef-type K+ transport system membrane component KefB
MIFYIAVMLIAGSIVGRLARFCKLPQVVGFLIAGLALGQSGFRLLNGTLTETLSPLSSCVLSLICFVIGGSLKLRTLKEHKRQFVSILIAGAFLPFILVTALLLICGALMGLTREIVAVAFLLGSISVATAPASITVLKENRAAGPLATIMQGVIAMDDAFGLVLYAFSSAAIKIVFENGVFAGSSDRILQHLFIVGQTIVMPLVLGAAAGFLLHLLTLKLSHEGALVSCMLGAVFLLAASCEYFKSNAILASVAMGFIVTNVSGGAAKTTNAKPASERIFSLADQFTPPMFVIFFVLIGAAADVRTITREGGIFALLYLIGRTGGKMAGSSYGATISAAPLAVRENIKFCLLNQAGVAMGLALTAAYDFPGYIGDTVLFVITATVFVVQIIGPIGVKYAVTRAGEIHAQPEAPPA